MNYKTCPLKKRPVFYDQVRNVNSQSVEEEPQDLSVKRKAEEECCSIAKRNFPLNLSTTSIYDQMKQASYIWHSTESIPRTESPVSDYSESSVQRETSLSPPAESLPSGVHLRGLTPVQVNQAYLSQHRFGNYLPTVLPSNLTPPASPIQESEPEDLSMKSGVPLTVLYHHHHQPAVMSQHEKIDDRSRFRCEKCGKSYSTLTGLSKHTQFHCPAAECNQVKKTFSCKSCEKVYTSLGALKMHIRTHTLPCRCNICGKAFSRPWLLQGHIRTHTGEKPFECDHCHRAFADRSNLRAHQQTHVEVKKYICDCCNKSFSRMSLLNKHVQGGCPGQTF